MAKPKKYIAYVSQKIDSPKDEWWTIDIIGADDILQAQEIAYDMVRESLVNIQKIEEVK